MSVDNKYEERPAFESSFQEPAEFHRKGTCVEVAASNGPKYRIYFITQEDADMVVRAFWKARADVKAGYERGRSQSQVERGLESGMLQPSKHTITNGDRTFPRSLYDDEKVLYPDSVLVVEFNGNMEALHEAGRQALQKLGYID